MTRALRGLLLVLFASFPLLTAAQPFDAAVSGDAIFGCMILPIVIPNLEWVNPDDGEENTDIAAIASNDGRRVLGVTGLNPYSVVQVRPDGSRTPFYTGSGFGREITVADNGRVYVLANITGNFRIDRISASGTLEASYPVLNIRALDVAPDGCTIFYASGNTIGRINGCTGDALPDFATVDIPTDIEVQPDGQVLIATVDDVLLFSAAGTLVRTVATLSSYGFNPDEISFDQAAVRDGVLWVAAMNRCEQDASFLIRASYSDGAELSRRTLVLLNAATGLVVGAAAAAIPTLGEVVLALLALALAAGGALTLRLR